MTEFEVLGGDFAPGTYRLNQLGSWLVAVQPITDHDIASLKRAATSAAVRALLADGFAELEAALSSGDEELISFFGRTKRGKEFVAAVTESELPTLMDIAARNRPKNTQSENSFPDIDAEGSPEFDLGLFPGDSGISLALDEAPATPQRRDATRTGNLRSKGDDTTKRRAQDNDDSNLKIVSQYRLEQGLLSSKYTAYYGCPNPECNKPLKSPQQEIGLEDSCPYCETEFQLCPERLNQPIQEDDQRRDNVQRSTYRKDAKNNFTNAGARYYVVDHGKKTNLMSADEAVDLYSKWKVDDTAMVVNERGDTMRVKRFAREREYELKKKALLKKEEQQQQRLAKRAKRDQEAEKPPGILFNTTACVVAIAGMFIVFAVIPYSIAHWMTGGFPLRAPTSSSSYTESAREEPSSGSGYIDYNSPEFQNASPEVQEDAIIFNALRSQGYSEEEAASSVIRTMDQ